MKLNTMKDIFGDNSNRPYGTILVLRLVFPGYELPGYSRMSLRDISILKLMRRTKIKKIFAATLNELD